MEKAYRSGDFRQGVRSRSLWLWAALLGVSGLWLFLILAAPAAAYSGLHALSDNVYGFFGYVCHQQEARSFFLLGNKFAVCSRCFGVYLGLFAGTLFYPLVRPMDESDPLPRFWLFASMLPIAVDWSLGIFEVWENTFFTRVASGLILGIGCAVFIIPALVEIAESRLLKALQTKKAA